MHFFPFFYFVRVDLKITFVPQEVEEETGAAEEQPVSNRLPVLRCNSKRKRWFYRPSLSFTCPSSIYLWDKKAPHSRNSRLTA